MDRAEKIEKLKELEREESLLLEMMRDLRWMAYHEAGHAVIAYLLGVPVELVTIKKAPFPDKPDDLKIMGGRVEFGNSDNYSEFANKYYLMVRSMISNAGYYAQNKRFPVKNGKERDEIFLNAEDDFKADSEIFTLLSEEKGTHEAVQFSNGILILLLELFDVPHVWKLIECVAWALLDSTELSGAEFEELVSEFFSDEDITQLQKDLIDIPPCEESPN